MSQSQLGRSKLKITIGSGVNRVEFSGEAAPLLTPLLHPMNWSVKDVMIQSQEEQGTAKLSLRELFDRMFCSNIWLGLKPTRQRFFDQGRSAANEILRIN